MALKIDEKLMRKYLDIELTTWGSGSRAEFWEKFYRDHAAWLVELTDGTIFRIEKPHIETSFCYGESGYDADAAYAAADRARTDENHFRWANLKGLNEKIWLLGTKTVDVYGLNGGYKVFEDLYITPDAKVVDNFFTRHYWNYGEDKVKKLDFEDRMRLLRGYTLVRDDFALRVDRYLKRYGLSKVRSWTYWRDA